MDTGGVFICHQDHFTISICFSKSRRLCIRLPADRYRVFTSMFPGYDFIFSPWPFQWNLQALQKNEQIRNSPICFRCGHPGNCIAGAGPGNDRFKSAPANGHHLIFCVIDHGDGLVPDRFQNMGHKKIHCKYNSQWIGWNQHLEVYPCLSSLSKAIAFGNKMLFSRCTCLCKSFSYSSSFLYKMV